MVAGVLIIAPVVIYICMQVRDVPKKGGASIYRDARDQVSTEEIYQYIVLYMYIYVV